VGKYTTDYHDFHISVGMMGIDISPFSSSDKEVYM